ncbi:MAG: hypothetical protein KF687_16195 [Cyclobacteriaceae bacterium]|nr:hypothetical protein [Cyclobacteriaceae bacterium]
MKTKSKFLICLMLVCFMAVTCTDDLSVARADADAPIDDELPIEPPKLWNPDPWDFEEGVYIAGYSAGGVAPGGVASVLGGSALQHLATSEEAWASNAIDVFVSGNDVYVAGWDDRGWDPGDIGHGVACATVWKNGEAQYLTELDDEEEYLVDSRANAVFVWNDDVYVAGSQTKVGYGDPGPFWYYNAIIVESKAMVWKNGEPQTLSALEGKSAGANSVFVSDGDVYVAGFEGSNAILWKNGTRQMLFAGTNATSVFVVGTDVYVAGITAGSGSTSAVVWKNGVPQYTISDSNYASSVFVVGADVYVAGSRLGFKHCDRYPICSFNIAMVWKNGESYPLSVPQQPQDLNEIASSNCYSVFVSGDDVYAVGMSSFDYNSGSTAGGSEIPVIWKNGTPQRLSGLVEWPSALFVRK